MARCPVKVFESISKLVLDASAITSLDPPCPLSVRFAALQRTLDAIVKHGGDGIGGDGLDLVRFSIWFRYLVETGLLANNEKKDSTRGLFKKALSIVTSAHNTVRPTIFILV